VLFWSGLKWLTIVFTSLTVAEEISSHITSRNLNSSVPN
jgi:hypothetical protein